MKCLITFNYGFNGDNLRTVIKLMDLNGVSYFSGFDNGNGCCVHIVINGECLKVVIMVL